MGGPNEREIGLCMWKQIGTFCCFNWSRHCINIPQAKYLFSVHSQIEPSIIIVYPWVRTSPKRRFLFSGWPGCSFHYIAKNVNTQVLLGLRSVMFVRTPMCLDLLCPFEKEIWKPADHEVNFFLLIIIIIFSLLCFDNKLPVINESLYSPALDKEKKEQNKKWGRSVFVEDNPAHCKGLLQFESSLGKESRMDVKDIDDHCSNMTRKWEIEHSPSH